MTSTTLFRPVARVACLGVSEILKIAAQATAMQRAGGNVIILGAGEPDFDTPDHIQKAAARAMRDGATKCTALDGTAGLKAAIGDRFRADNGLHFDAAQITVGAGARQILFNAMMATLDDGDEVIIPTPCWTSCAGFVRIAGGQPVLLPCADTAVVRMIADQRERAITPRTRRLLLNSPSNSTGAGCSAIDFAPLLEVLARHRQVWLMVDDIHEKIVYDGFAFATPAQFAPDLCDRSLTVNGLSRAYAMTGRRIGYGAGTVDLIRRWRWCKASRPLASLRLHRRPCAARRTRWKPCASRSRGWRDMIVAGLTAIPGIRCPMPDGALYTFANRARILGRQTPEGVVIGTDSDFCAWLLRDHGVAVVPGSALGLSPCFRISCAAAAPDLAEALARIARAMASLRPAALAV